MQSGLKQNFSLFCRKKRVQSSMRRLSIWFSVFVFIAVCCISMLWGFSSTQNAGDDINGIWMTESRQSMVQVYRIGDKYFGKVYWLKFPNDPDNGKPKVDKKNPDPKLRSRAILGLQLVNNFTYDSKEKEWGGGTIYDPKSGNTYNCKATMMDKNTLKVRGYVGFSWMGLGRTEVWKKIMN
jgi:uncharacterized protein (DUF2147 family)